MIHRAGITVQNGAVRMKNAAPVAFPKAASSPPSAKPSRGQSGAVLPPPGLHLPRAVGSGSFRTAAEGNARRIERRGVHCVRRQAAESAGIAKKEWRRGRECRRVDRAVQALLQAARRGGRNAVLSFGGWLA